VGAPLVALALAATLLQASTAERIADIQVHGNLAANDAEVRQIAAVEVGSPIGPTTLDEIVARLRASKRFQHAEVLKRYASIADPTQITLVIIVEEGPVHVELTGDPDHPTRVVRDHGTRLLLLPILEAEDGYGVSYGARLALPNPLGANSRLSVPLAWGGQKQAALELDKRMTPGPFTRIITRFTTGVSIDARKNPHYQRDDERARVWARVERELTSQLRVGATAGWERVSFGGDDASVPHGGADIVLDTRVDPFLARNAVYLRASAERFAVPTAGVTRTEIDARGYVGLFAQNILVVRALQSGSSGPLPPYLQPLLGGIANLRGFGAGTAAGDTLFAGSVEVLAPLTSPLRIGKMGVSAFTDVGAVANDGERIADQRFRQGVGASVWFSAAFVRLNVAVAHGIGASTRVHIGGSLSF
jgi:outer membrane protein assembly factor BamA